MLVYCFLKNLPVSNITLFVLLFFLSLLSVSALSGHSKARRVHGRDWDFCPWHLFKSLHRAIREAARNKLIEGVTLDSKFSMSRIASRIGVRVTYVPEPRMHQISFPPVRNRREGYILVRVSANVLIMQNIPSREGYQYVFFIVDHAMC